MNNPSQITKEQAEAVFDLRAGYQLGHADIDILRKLAEYARAVMDSKPVAWTSEEAIAEVYCDETGMIGPKYMVGDVPLYRHAQPAPVFPKATPSLKAMMQALDAFYAEEEVPERGMLLAFRILLDDTCRTAVQSFGNPEQLEPVSQPYKLPPNSFTDAELEMMSHGDNPQANAYRELLAFRHNSPVIPDGWVLVPVEPTKEMIKSGANAASTGMLIPGMYRAMLAAAPQQE